jgi:PAS domain S-box-containing protein
MQDRKKSKKESTREPSVLRRQAKNLKTIKNKLKQAEETTQRCKELHNLLLETIPHGIQECDTYGTITYFNASFCRITGYDKDELVGKDIWDFFDSEAERQGLESYFLTIIKEKPLPTPYTLKMQTKDGRPVILQVDWNYKYDVQGKLAGFVSVITDITKRRQTEENLLKEIIFSQALINSLPGFFYLIDPDGGFVRWNRNLEEFYGYSAEEFTRLKVLDHVADKDKERAMIRMQEVLTKGQSSAEVEVISREGKTVPFLFTGVRIDIDNKPYLIGIGIDISKRKETERHLHIQYSINKIMAESADVNETLLKILQVICEYNGWGIGEIWSIDRETDTLRLNTIWHKPSWDVEEFEVISKNTTFQYGKGLPGRVWESGKPAWISDVITDPNFLRESIASKTGLHAAFAFPVKTSLGITCVITFFSHDIRTVDSDLLQMFDAIGDQIGGFIERRQLEEALKIREHHQAILSKLGQRALADMDLSILMDKSVKIAAKTLGVEYCKILEILPDRNSLILRAGVGWKEGLVGYTTVDAGTDSQAGYTLLSDEPVIVKNLRTETRFSGPPLLHDHGIISGISVIIGDINRPYGVLGAHTGKQRTFTQDDVNFLQNIANILATAIDRKQAENEIRKMQKLESIGVLAGGIAHDFNNLLTVILGNISLLKIYISKEHKMYDRLTDAENACMKAKELSYRLLTFSKGGEPLKEETLISNILKRTVTLTLGYSPASYELIIPDNLYPVKIDEGQIEQVLRNIVNNAREAMPDGGTIRVYAENISVSKENRLPLKEGNYVKISIEDRGCGISEENLPKIFDPYFTTKDIGAEKGQGLGLSICYSIIKTHGGLISVESRTGLGTTVHIYLPAF